MWPQYDDNVVPDYIDNADDQTARRDGTRLMVIATAGHLRHVLL